MMMRLATFALPAAALALAGAVSLHAQPAAPVAAAAAAPADGLPEGPGKATLLKVCAGCHEPTIVATQRHTEKDWHDLVELMAGNGAQGSDAEFAEITAYLAKSFPAGQ